MFEEMTDEPDLASGRRRPRIRPNPIIRRRRVHSRRYILHSFEPYKSELTAEHERQIASTVSAIKKSIANKAPLSQITIEGHAAWFGPNPVIPYTEQGRRRAVNVRNRLEQLLRSENFEIIHRVDLGKPISHGKDQARVSNSSQSNRALNRRVEVTLSEFDPSEAPYRWMCQLETVFDQKVHSPTDLTHTIPKGAIVKGSGVLISDRHVLTAAHNVRSLMKLKGRLLWKEATNILVTPFARSGGHIDTTPFGRWEGRTDKVKTFPGYLNIIRPGDYKGHMPQGALLTRFTGTDLAIIELKPKRNQKLGTKRLKNNSLFGWWGRIPQFQIGVSIQQRLLDTKKTRPTTFRALGFPNGFPDFRRGTVLLDHSGTGVESSNSQLVSGHSGSPYWVQVSGIHRLLAIHHGNKRSRLKGSDGVLKDYGVLIDRNKEDWINSII